MDKKQPPKRKTLKALLGGTGAIAGAKALPEKWGKPIVSSVILPAHASTTARAADDCPYTFFTPAIEGESEIYVQMRGTGDSPSSEVGVELEVNFNDAEGEGQSYDTVVELFTLVSPGVSLEIPTESQNESEAQISEINSVEARFEVDGQECNIEWD